ncbi:HDR004Wp [Eremothecium sinecaudum]|uniref:HDR004Wp n=1 Tax=Eremothecium sinecaudum TaxID=45286 RepID=A0A109UX40_9SACH|nr:HDR004Wp [Eremothecium sinecaudum]AMD20747.1 HDR004Wp [Eremothecium sinecaudum]
MATPNDKDAHDRYGVVIDAGSSGSRIYIYKWVDPSKILEDNNEGSKKLLHSVPQIYHEQSWSKKITPGMSTYANRPEKAFKKHIKPLLEFAEDIIPDNKIPETPVFIQSTAGMRLLDDKAKQRISKELCKKIGQKTDFMLTNCATQIQTIDGETEGLYGWIALNYLKGYFNDYDKSASVHESYGFMDMGGASLQIAFKPSNEQEVDKHREDISTIILSSVNGDIQEWDVFSGTWLRFGTNEARKKYLIQLANNIYGHEPENVIKNGRKKLYDPCLLKGATTEFKFGDTTFDVVGSGNYEQCGKSMYPLLLKNVPCIDEPCLFNGVHVPKIDFTKDQFLGVSEYWYTMNDVFNLGGEYSYQNFNDKLKQFCENDWQVIKDNRNNGMYNNIQEDLLKDACFKGNWILNVLHEGFELPGIGDNSHIDEQLQKELEKHMSFMSADTVDGKELSWTLGKIVLYASSMVTAGKAGEFVGLKPSTKYGETHGGGFVPGYISNIEGSISGNLIDSMLKMMLGLMVFFALYLLYVKLYLNKYVNTTSMKTIVNSIQNKVSKIRYSKVSLTDQLNQLEEGVLSATRFGENRDGVQFRSRNTTSTQLSGEVFPMQDRGAAGTLSPALSEGPSRATFSLNDFSKFNRSSLQ